MTNPHPSTDPPVSDTVKTLVLDLLEWVGPNPRPYSEVIEAWRTSCPRAFIRLGTVGLAQHRAVDVALYIRAGDELAEAARAVRVDDRGP